MHSQSAVFMKHPACSSFTSEDKRRTCFRNPKPKKNNKWKERRWDTKILTELEVDHVLLTKEAFGLIFSSGNVAGEAMLPAFFGRCLTYNFWTLAKGTPLDFSSKLTSRWTSSEMFRVYMLRGRHRWTCCEGQRVLGDQEAKARPRQRKENARRRISGEPGGRQVINAVSFKLL